MAKIGQQKLYHLKIFHLAPLNPIKLNSLLTSGIDKKGVLNGTILEYAKISPTKMVPF